MPLQNSSDLGRYDFKTPAINGRIGATTEPDEAIGIYAGEIVSTGPALAVDAFVVAPPSGCEVVGAALGDRS